MNIRALTTAAFVSALILTGCPAPFSQSETSNPAPGPVPVATWVAQGIPGDLEIAYSYSYGHRLGGEAIQISADGTATYAYSPDGEQEKRFAGKLSPEALRRVVLAFADKRFFSLTLVHGCVVDAEAPPTFSDNRPAEHITEAAQRWVSIRINGTSWEIKRDEGYSGCSAISNRGDANFMSLIGVLRGAVASLPPVTPTAVATGEPVVSTPTPTGP